MNLEDRITQATAKLRALAYLFSQARPEIPFDETEMEGVGYLLADIGEDIEAVLEAPANLLAWAPPLENVTEGRA